jgi:hypothetical protein
MPISPERKLLYPANWSTEIRPRILDRARNRCERCGVPNHVIAYRFVDDGAHYFMLCGGEVFDAETGKKLGLARVYELPPGRYVEIVLTIAHVHDPDPASCDDDNLAAWCQRCHNNHDRPMRLAHAAATRRANSPTPDLFDN